MNKPPFHGHYEPSGDGSIIAATGEVAGFSMKRFRLDIVDGECCFMCGKSKSAILFNDEHVFPNWLLREAHLHSKEVTLPNTKAQKYSTLRIPCCKSCNTFLGEFVEEPVSQILKGGFKKTIEHAKSNGTKMLFAWMALVYLKVHLKDKEYRMHLDTRVESKNIGDVYEWGDLHHIHCIARSPLTGAELSPEIAGTLWIFPASVQDSSLNFDYADLHYANSMLLRLGDVIILTTFNDCRAVDAIASKQLHESIGANSVSKIQAREILCRVAFLNLRLKNRARFYSVVRNGVYWICAEPPSGELIAPDMAIYGKMMAHVCGSVLRECQIANSEEIIQQLAKGNWTFLNDQTGAFITNAP